MKQIDDFVDVASSYCSLIDQCANTEVDGFVKQVRETLPLLYYHALQLPDREPDDEDIGRTITHDQWKSVYDGISDLLGKNNLYWEIGCGPFLDQHNDRDQIIDCEKRFRLLRGGSSSKFAANGGRVLCSTS